MKSKEQNPILNKNVVIEAFLLSMDSFHATSPLSILLSTSLKGRPSYWGSSLTGGRVFFSMCFAHSSVLLQWHHRHQALGPSVLLRMIGFQRLP